MGAFFLALGVRILQGYGQTEAAPVIAVNRPGHNRIETVGPAMLGVELRIAGDGEILVRGELVMRGYWRDSAATAQAIDADGWLHTGDIGEIDPDGCLRITDRKKDIIVNSGGDNVAPQRIEGFLTLEPEIAQAMVHGDRRPHLVALIVPDRDWVQSWAEANGQSDSLTNIMNGAELRKALSLAIDRVNRQLSPIEKIRRFMVITAPFDIENGMLTPTLKIRRHQIRAIYGSALDGLYEEKSQGRDQAFQ